MSEKQAMARAQNILASELDAELPSRPFATWFRQLVGAEAGVNWQLNECSEQLNLLLEQDQDLPACAEANALLPDGRKVVVVIEVGTFKKGITGIPSFSHAAIERQGELFRVRRLSDLPEGLRNPNALAKEKSIKLAALATPPVLLAMLAPNVKTLNHISAYDDAPPPPTPKMVVSPPPETRNLSEDVLLGTVITRVQPLYPASAKKLNVSGKVEVMVTISVEGRVIEAVAISGHQLLRSAALDAARRWIFKPTMMNDFPVQAKSVLTFVFAPNQ